jgi:hypothetical protein
MDFYFNDYSNFSTQHALPSGRTPAPTNYPYSFIPHEPCSYCSDPYHSASNCPSWGQFYNFLLVFWSHSVFGQNHLYVRMLQTGIPLFRVKSEEFQKFPVSRPDDVSSRPDSHLSTAPSVRTPDSPASSVRTMCFFRPDTSLYREVSVPAFSVRTFQQHVRAPISSRTVH